MYRDYRRVEGFEDYIISNYGEVYSIKRKQTREIKPSLRKGYNKVSLCQNGTVKTMNIHILVGNAFIGKRTGEFTFDHIDQCKSNNRADNIRLASRSVQNINRNHKIGKLNEKYITFYNRNNKQYYKFQIQRKINGIKKKIIQKQYNVDKHTLDDVIKDRDEYIKNNPSLFISE